jgi:hypothetical protein
LTTRQDNMGRRAELNAFARYIEQPLLELYMDINLAQPELAIADRKKAARRPRVVPVPETLKRFRQLRERRKKEGCCLWVVSQQLAAKPFVIPRAAIRKKALLWSDYGILTLKAA